MYARVLVDVDMSGKLFESVLVEREGHAFPITVQYEKQPSYCAHCRMLGHSIQNCLKLSSSTHHEGLDKVTRKGQSAMQHHKHKTKDSMVDKQPELTTEHHIEEVAPEPVHKSDLLTAQHFSKVMEESPVQRNIEKKGDNHDETVKSVTTKEKASSPTLATHNSCFAY